MGQSGITLCMISRDESKCIANAIRSVTGLVDDIIVVDTGSTDGTPGIAASLGARVFKQPWEDSFSKPRNLAMEQVRTKWALVLDCDETLREESRQPIVDACNAAAADGLVATIMVHGPEGVSPTRMMRLGRADKGYRFVNRVHERPNADVKPIFVPNFVIDHYGYLYKPSATKAALYNRLLLLDLADRPADNYLLINVAHNFWAAGDGRWAEYLPRAIATLPLQAERPPHMLVALLIEMILSVPAENLPAGFTQANADELAERWFPASLPLLLVRAKWRLRSGRQADGKLMAQRALKLWESKTFRGDVAFKTGPLVAELQRVAAIA